MDRIRLNYRPEWDGPVAGWAINYIRKNYWRVAAQHEFEDLIQEAYIKFLVCKRRYCRVNNPRHFMSLFQRALSNHIHTLSTKASRQVGLQIYGADMDGQYAEILASIPGDMSNKGHLNLLLEEAPIEVKQFLTAVASGAIADGLRKGHRKRKIGRRHYIRETTNQFICRLMGMDPERINVVKMTKDHFSVG